MRLTLRQMEIFLNVVKEGQVTNVAREMGLSQSAISMSIKEPRGNILGNPLLLIGINIKRFIPLIGNGDGFLWRKRN